MPRLRPMQPATLWLDASGFRPAPLFVRGVPRLVSNARAAELLTFAEMEELQADDLIWVQLSNSFRRAGVSFDAFSTVMKPWAGTAALVRLCYLVNQHHSKFWKVAELADEMDVVAYSDVELTAAESFHVAMCFTLLRGSKGVVDFGSGSSDDMESDSIVQLALLVRGFGVTAVAAYITPGCSLSMLGHAIEHGIDPELLSAVEDSL